MQPNLLPAPIKERLRLRQRFALWVQGTVAISLLGIAVCVVANVLLSDMDTPVREELHQVKSVINRLEASEAAAIRQIELVTHELGVAEDIVGQPDWSILFGVLAAGLTDGAYLETLTTSLVEDDEGLEVPPPGNTATGPYRVTVTGVSLLQGDATRYALFLEQCRLFDSVRLVATLPRPDVSERAVGFEIMCEIGHIEEEASQ
ncbi:MAG: hypothetical protein ED559_05955 [Phycisphaera sp.]|nr:MAG: hypothetical protein ED559_05955 [Phycisphaera sp.]